MTSSALFLYVLSVAATCRADITIKGISLSSGLTQAEKKALLDEHNALRTMQAAGGVSRQPAAADMVRLEWSDAAASHAQVWANRCGGRPHGNHKEYGEGQNYAGYSVRQELLSYSIQQWFHEEHRYYRYGAQQIFRAGHYTQMVTAYSHKVGCGANKCPGHAFARLVCNFLVGGNFYGKPPFEKGTACTKCPAGYGFCKDKLCTSARVCRASDRSCRCTVNRAKCKAHGRFDHTRCMCKCNPGYQGLNCDVPCDDPVNKNCNSRKEKGQCTPSARNNLFVDTYLHCPGACGRCKPVCKNYSNDCAKYKAWKYCERNDKYVIRHCPKECGFCK